MPHEPGHQEEHMKGEHRAMLPEDAPTWQIDVAEGAEVVTSDGDKLGEVKEVRGGYFKVNARMQMDYWLQRQFVTSNDDGRVTMSFTKHDADNYKVKELPDSAVLQGQDADYVAKHGDNATGFETETVGGPVLDPADDATNPASATLQAAERQYDREHRP